MPVAGLQPLGQILKEMELVNEGQLQEALALQRKQGGAIGAILVDKNYITRDELLLALGAQMGMDVVNLEEMEIPAEVIGMVPPIMARNYNIIPVEVDDGRIVVAMANPHDINVLDDLRYMLRMEVNGAVASEDAIRAAVVEFPPQSRYTIKFCAQFEIGNV